MKTWITYIAAILMGLATSLLFSSFPATAGILSSVSSYLINIGVFIAIPVTFITLSSGTASLMKDRKGFRTFGISLLWAIVSAVVMASAAALLFVVNPVSFPVTSSAGSAPGALSSHVSYMLTTATSSLFPINAFWTIGTTTRFIFPLIVVSWILGLALKPSADIIRPAYTTMNSFSEVMYRISRTYSVLGFFIVYFASASMFTQMYQEKTLLAVPEYAKSLGIAIGAVFIIVIPLLYAIFTGFRKNPYKVIYRALAPALMGLTTENIITAIPLNESIARNSLGVQKRIASTVTPLMAVIGKGGRAFISVLSLLSLFQATTETSPSSTVIIITALTAAAVSFISSASNGTEALMITVITLQLLGINLYGGENAMIAFMPLLCGIGTMLDAALTACANSIAASAVGTDIEVPYKDTI